MYGIICTPLIRTVSCENSNARMKISYKKSYHAANVCEYWQRHTMFASLIFVVATLHILLIECDIVLFSFIKPRMHDRANDRRYFRYETAYARKGKVMLFFNWNIVWRWIWIISLLFSKKFSDLFECICPKILDGTVPLSILSYHQRSPLNDRERDREE